MQPFFGLYSTFSQPSYDAAPTFFDTPDQFHYNRKGNYSIVPINIYFLKKKRFATDWEVQKFNMSSSTTIKLNICYITESLRLMTLKVYTATSVKN